MYNDDITVYYIVIIHYMNILIFFSQVIIHMNPLVQILWWIRFSLYYCYIF